MVFQGLVLAATLYAAALRRLPPAVRTVAQLALFAAAAASPSSPVATSSARPQAALALGLLRCAAAPFLALSSVTASLEDPDETSPLFSASNAGALAALAAFPFLLEPLVALPLQRAAWRVACLACAALWFGVPFPESRSEGGRDAGARETLARLALAAAP